MPSILKQDDNVSYIARKSFQLNGKKINKGDDIPEINDHYRLETWVRAGFVIPVVKDKSKLPFQFRRTVMTREMALFKLKVGNPEGSHDLTDPKKKHEAPELTGTDPNATDRNDAWVANEVDAKGKPVKEEKQTKESSGTKEREEVKAYPHDHGVDEVVAYAKDHPDELENLIDAEERGKERSTLLEKLYSLLDNRLDDEDDEDIEV